jgi:hypothetical protein
VLYINPGSAGPQRFHLPITLARLDLSTKPWTVDLRNLRCGLSSSIAWPRPNKG